MSNEQIHSIETTHRLLLEDHDIDYRLLTTRNAAGGINVHAEQAFTADGVGSKSKGGRGLLLILDVGTNEVRIEVSRALESVYPDAFVGYMQTKQMLPFFSAGRVSDGILASTEMIVTRAQRATANQGWDDEQWARASTAGAGATARARLNEPPATVKSAKEAVGQVAMNGDSPSDTLNAYMKAMEAHNTSPSIKIYSTSTQAVLSQWVRTTAQMDNMLAVYRGCSSPEVKFNTELMAAVIRYPIESRQCSPWFFVREAESWRLDLVSLQEHIRFGRDNSWHFNRSSTSINPFQFAFLDWDIDNNGYPQHR